MQDHQVDAARQEEKRAKRNRARESRAHDMSDSEAIRAGLKRANKATARERRVKKIANQISGNLPDFLNKPPYTSPHSPEEVDHARSVADDIKAAEEKRLANQARTKVADIIFFRNLDKWTKPLTAVEAMAAAAEAKAEAAAANAAAEFTGT